MNYKIAVLFSLMIYTTQLFASNNIIIDGKKTKNLVEMQLRIEKQFEMRRNSGKELEAIYEVLISDLKTESIIRIKHLEILKKKLGEQYVQDFVETVSRAAEDNLHVILIIE